MEAPHASQSLTLTLTLTLIGGATCISVSREVYQRAIQLSWLDACLDPHKEIEVGRFSAGIVVNDTLISQNHLSQQEKP